MENLRNLRETLTREGALICFNGSFSQGIIEELGKAVKKYLESEEVEKPSLMDVFSVYVEAAQNVRNYGARSDLPETERRWLGGGVIAIGRYGDRYAVSSGNVVRREDGEALVAYLDRLKDLDRAGLKALYKERLRSDPAPGATGAGLGLIDMARKASEPLQYALDPEDDGHALFSLRVIV